MSPPNDGPHPIVAALGPTNTGKTHHAVERMLEHRTGMIGLPLRLLAREVYDRVTARVGENRVALVTGEERRVPPRPQYWVCTTEAMPMDRDVDFVAVDEIQLATHPQRGHVFTDRILHARGVRETWLMGADTMRDRVAELVPTADIQRRPRLSRLTSAGRISLKALPPRSAIVAFSAAQVYEFAERVQRRHGGTAVVLGALSPRTRNAQVAMYQAGEVQYMVATDAIGMGLNMNVDLVAFASVRKFDGQRDRWLEPSELAQIAGRAGRHMNDGSFATLTPLPALAPDVVFALESHVFPPVRRLLWRSTDLDMSSIDALLVSLRIRPKRACLEWVDRAEDMSALESLAQDPEIRRIANHPERIATLWAVCQIPDFRQLLFDSHIRLLAEIYAQLTGPRGAIDTDWMAGRIARLDDTQGDIETLMSRIAFIRTWTYVANHPAWVMAASHWQQRTRAIEDRLSDALHDALVQRFVSREAPRGTGRAGGRVRRARAPATDIAPKAGGPFAALAGLKVSSSRSEPALTTIEDWLEAVVEAPHEAFEVDELGRVLFEGEAIARLSKGADLLRPEAVLTVAQELGAGARLRLQRRMSAFLRDWVDALLGPLRGADWRGLTPAGRGLVFQLEQRLGTVSMEQARPQVRDLASTDRKLLKEREIAIGQYTVFARKLLEPAALRERAVLCFSYLALRPFPPLLKADSTSCPIDPALDSSVYTSLGYPVVGSRGLRADIWDRVSGELARASSTGPFAVPQRVLDWLGMDTAARGWGEIATAFGYRVVAEGQWERRKGPNRKQRR